MAEVMDILDSSAYMAVVMDILGRMAYVADWSWTLR